MSIKSQSNGNQYSCRNNVSQVRPRREPRKQQVSLAAQRAPVPFRGRRRRLLAMVLARAPVLAAVVRPVALLLAAAPGPPLAPVEGVAPARSIAVTHLGPNGLKIEKETTHDLV